jgi:hypothetical protein
VKHKSEVCYTNNDDGLWVYCTGCAWQANVGYFPTVEDIVAAWTAHLEGRP